jgi:hypothetical protein
MKSSKKEINDILLQAQSSIHYCNLLIKQNENFKKKEKQIKIKN